MPRFGSGSTEPGVLATEAGSLTTERRNQILAKARRLTRQRATLHPADAEWLDTWADFADAEVTYRFRSITEKARTFIQTKYLGLHLGAARAQLAEVNPGIQRPDGPEAFALAAVNLHGLEGVAFDTVREARALVAYIDEEWPLWRAVWSRMAIASTKEQAESDFLTKVSDEVEIRAQVAEFLSFYSTTMDRVYRAYTKVSRILEADKPAYNLPGSGWSPRHPG